MSEKHSAETGILPTDINKVDIEHALKFPVVVQHLFKMMIATLAFTDFKNFRLVCRAWYEETLSLWRKTAILTLHNAPLLTPSRRPGINPQIFLMELENPQGFHNLVTKPYEKYKVFNLEINLDHASQNEDASRFWSLLGPSVKHMILDTVIIGSTIYSEYDENILLRFFRQKMPNVEHLTMIKITENVDEVALDYHAMPKSNLPALKSLTVDDTAYIYLCDVPNLENLTGLTKMHLSLLFVCPLDQVYMSNHSVKRLNLIDNFHDFSSINEDMRFTCLEHFGLAVEYPNRDNHFLRHVEQLCTFLLNHSNTLKSVHLFQWNLKSRVTTSPISVEMKHVKEVKLWGKVVTNLTFLKFLPNLSSLHIDVLAFKKRKHMERHMNKIKRLGDNVTIHELETDLVAGALQCDINLPNLTYLFISCRLSQKSFQALGKWMPNLKSLKAILNCATLPVVAQQWKRLETLHCLWGTRLSDNDLQSLVQLQQLKSFAYDAVCRDSGLAAGSLHVFLACPQITHLKLCVSSQFPEETERLLKEKIQHVWIHRNSRENETHKHWSCCEFERHKRIILNSNENAASDEEDRRLASSDTEDSM